MKGGDIMRYRQKISKKRSKKLFVKTSGKRKINVRVGLKRGGTRL